MTTVPVRVGAVLATAGLLLGMLSACTPQPEPTPTKTALFASDEEAFAAAEETYSAYNDAGNASRRDDNAATPNDYLMGEALESAIDGKNQLLEAGLTLEGDVKLAEFLPKSDSLTETRSQLMATVCLDLSATHVLRDGQEASLPDRPEMVAQLVQMTWVADEFLISKEVESEVGSCDA